MFSAWSEELDAAAAVRGIASGRGGFTDIPARRGDCFFGGMESGAQLRNR